MKTYVYIIEQVGGSACKIGISGDPFHRMVTLQRKNPDRIAIRYLIEPREDNGAYALEMAIHHFLRDARLDGEWFRLDAQQAFRAIYAEIRLMEKVERVIEYPKWVIRKRPVQKRQLPHVRVHWPGMPSFHTRAFLLFLVASFTALFMMFGAWRGDILLSVSEFFSYLFVVVASCIGMLAAAIGSFEGGNNR